MKKLALIGKNISHSLSPEIYRKLMSPDILYDLIDVQSEDELPSVQELARNYEGVNITSPYKRSYLNQVENSHDFERLECLNCLSFGKRIKGENTDFLALKKLIPQYIDEKDIVLLGDGNMSKITQVILDELNLGYKVFSRKKGNLRPDLDLERSSLVINTCSRDFIFQGKIKEGSLFWDYNYSFSPHEKFFKYQKKLTYLNGRELLLLQAKEAVLFWTKSD